MWRIPKFLTLEEGAMYKFENSSYLEKYFKKISLIYVGKGKYEKLYGAESSFPLKSPTLRPPVYKFSKNHQFSFYKRDSNILYRKPKISIQTHASPSSEDRPNILDVSSFIKCKSFTLPRKPFVYNPTFSTDFSQQGAWMIDSLLSVTPNFPYYFNKKFSLERQREITYESFFKIRASWNEVQEKKSEEILDFERKAKGKKYFETNRKFERLVPPFYKRTSAPRLSALGSTFHGMKKELLIEILKRLSKEGDVSFIDIDMSAAHSRIARFLLSNNESDLGSSLKDPDFWSTQISALRHHFSDRNVDITDSHIKKILKVGLYTSLNGGNPCSDDRLLATLTFNAEDLLEKGNLNTIEKIKSSSLWSSSFDTLMSFSLIKEVKSLNEICAKQIDSKTYQVFTIDREEPYLIDSKHKGISRVLQGFEVVLLAVLTREILIHKCLPVSLDHDGVLIMTDNNTIPTDLCTSLSQSSFGSWSNYLLGEELPLEIKRIVRKGEVKNF